MDRDLHRTPRRLDLDGLNPPQREAVLHGDGPLVVFAGAGSGKTRVITYRIADLVSARDVRPWRILAVTFTNKAAGEMRERLAGLVPGGAEGLWVGTFHSTCARLLRLHTDAAGVRKDFTIYDDGDQRAVVKRVLADLSLDPKRFQPKAMAGAINRAKQEMVGPEDYETGDYWREQVARVYDAYEQRMAKAGALDFGDLIYRLTKALEENETLREDLAGRFRHVLVDEFQDTNHAQLRLVRALASVHGNLCVVGDDDQSIYRWRGADRRNILDFRDAYGDATVIKLEQNYRSTKRILRVAHAIIRRNLDREPKELWTDNGEGEKVLVLRTSDERAEALEVVKALLELQRQGHLLTDAAVFYRTHAQSRVLEDALRSANVAYRIVGGLRFYDRAEVKDLLAYLRLLHNPDDDVSVLRVLNVPARGIGKTSQSRLLDLAAEKGLGVLEALEHVEDDGRFSAAPTRRLVAFRDLVKHLRAEADKLPLEDLGGAVLQDTGYLAMLEADDSVEAETRLQNLEELVGSIRELVETRTAAGEETTLGDYLAEVTLQTSADTAEDAAADKVTLMTVHAAKGLEFRTVLVMGLEEGVFPMGGDPLREDPEEMEEERRLAYVAFTRAKERLVLTWAMRRRIFGQEKAGGPSRFLGDLPDEDTHRLGGGPSRRTPRAARPEFAPDPWDQPRKPDTRTDLGESFVDRSEYSDLDEGGIGPGTLVRHKKFGVGRVVSLDTGGMYPKAEVDFESAGRKKLIVRVLEPA
ncbi:MAG: UvrD-helicase domain-containing protein [Myxococcota bacterium]